MTLENSTPFPFIKASKLSLSMRKPVYGVGINDAGYVVSPSVHSRQVECRYYTVWKDMFKRCYSDKFHRKNPTYFDCFVVGEWHSFMAFREWMESQGWQGKELDKDVICPGNKMYGPDVCAFVSHEINSLLNDRAARRGHLPQGVYQPKHTAMFKASMLVFGKSKYIGYFETSEQASSSYREAKRLHILTIACCEPDIRVKQGLYRHSLLYAMSVK